MKNLSKLPILGFFALLLIFAGCAKEVTQTATIQPQLQDAEAGIQELSMPEKEFVQQLALLGCYDPSLIDLTGSCYAVLNPVCACGVVTFANACEARRFGFYNTTPGACALASCQSPLLKQLTSGTSCAAVYQPVCGCDGKTYGNACYAMINGVAIYTAGECGSIVQ